MADISFKLRAEALGKQMENLAPQVEAEINKAVGNLAHAAYVGMVARVQSMPTTDSKRKDYLKALKFKDLGDDSYLIYLDGEYANKIEEGIGAYSIRDILLKSKKIVKVGSRAGEPWVRTAKDGHKYAAVPFEHKPHAGDSGDLGRDIKSMLAKGTVSGQVQPITKTFTNAFGKPLQGKVAVAIPDSTGIKNHEGMVKYQHVSPKGRVSSVYMTYRMVSEKGKDWIHPGSKGWQLFKEAEEIVAREMDNIIKTLLK